MKKKKVWIIVAIVFAVVLLIIGGITILIVNSNNYEKLIQKKKAENPEKYEFFPDSLPENSSGWCKEELPPILQGNGYFSITVNCDDDYINQVMNEYEGKAIKCFFARNMTNGQVDGPYIVTDKDQMYVSSRYDENDSYKHPMYEFDYKIDDVSNIYFYNSFDGLNRKWGAIDSDFYDVRSVECAHKNKFCKEGVIVYILKDNDNWNHRHVSLVFVDIRNKIVEYYVE